MSNDSKKVYDNEKELELWGNFKTNPNPDDFGALYDTFSGTIGDSIRRWGGHHNPLPPQAVQATAMTIFNDALMDYDPNKGAKLSTHITNKLMSMGRFVRENKDIAHIPDDRLTQVFKMKDEEFFLEDRLGRTPSVAELSDHLQWPIKKVKLMKKELKKDLLSSRGMSREMESGFDTRNDELESGLKSMYLDLPPVQQSILEYTFGFHGQPKLTPNEIARKLKVQPSKVFYEKKKMADRFDNHYGQYLK